LVIFFVVGITLRNFSGLVDWYYKKRLAFALNS
jgi:hypothetical protein